MAENPDISQYFKEPSSDYQPTQTVNAVEISGDINSDKNNENDGSGGADKSEEPVICKIFQSTSSKNTLEPDPGSFFDTIGTTDQELVQGYLEQDSGIHSTSSGLKDSGDILSSFKTYDDNFSKIPRVTESERSRDAWIIPDSTRKVLIQMVTSPPGSYVPTRDILTMPGVILEEELKDTVYEAVHHYLGENEAAKRKILTAAEVTQDERGIRDLIQAGCYRGAVNLTKTLLTIYGQGAGRAGHPSKHTVHSIQEHVYCMASQQELPKANKKTKETLLLSLLAPVTTNIRLWFTRLALLVKLRSFSLAYVESEPFGDLEKPDMFFQFYPELYGGRTGSIVPFSLRLLIAQIPAFTEKHQQALTRLHAVLATIRKSVAQFLDILTINTGGYAVTKRQEILRDHIIFPLKIAHRIGVKEVKTKILSNLEKGQYEDGTPSEMSAEARRESVKLWTSRETRVLHAIVSCSLAFKDYSLAIEVMQMLIEREKDSQQKKSIQSALGRILLQLGDIASAEKQFALARSGISNLGPRDLIDSGLCSLSQNQFQEAYLLFEKAYELDPKNITALNNMSVCLLYLGKLKQAVLLLEEAIQKYTKIALHENLLLNLCTLYELQSSFYSQAKLKLLVLVNQNKGDGFNIACLKLQM